MISRRQIAVVIPAWNSASWLEQTLESVYAQSRTPDEIIVVDDASTDDTRALLERHRDRLKALYRPHNSGTADLPRYEGVQAATTEYCTFLDSDDLWHPDKLAVQLAFMEQHPHIPLSHHYVRRIDEQGRDLGIRHEGIIPPTGRIAGALLHHCFICTSAVMVRRETWLAARRHVVLAGYGTELDFFLVIARENDIGFIEKVLGSYRCASSGISRQNWKRGPRDVVALERVFRNRLWEGIVTRRQMKDLMAEAYLENASHHYHQGQFERVPYFAVRGWSRRHFDPRFPACLVKTAVKKIIRRND